MDYLRDAALHNVVGTVHVEAECDRSQQVAETLWLESMHESYGMPSAIVAHAWVDTPTAEEILAQQASRPLVRGIRTKPAISQGPGTKLASDGRSLHDPKWRRGLELLPKYGLSWDLRVPYWHLAESAAVIADLPKFPIALNHTGLPLDRTPEGLSIWRHGMELLAKHLQVHCKISALRVPGQAWTYESNKPVIDDAISIFGTGRCMFASNFPVDALLGSWDYIFSSYKRAIAHRDSGERAALLAGNAARFYRLTEIVPP